MFTNLKYLPLYLYIVTFYYGLTQCRRKLSFLEFLVHTRPCIRKQCPSKVGIFIPDLYRRRLKLGYRQQFFLRLYNQYISSRVLTERGLTQRPILLPPLPSHSQSLPLPCQTLKAFNVASYANILPPFSVHNPVGSLINVYFISSIRMKYS